MPDVKLSHILPTSPEIRKKGNMRPPKQPIHRNTKASSVTPSGLLRLDFMSFTPFLETVLDSVPT